MHPPLQLCLLFVLPVASSSEKNKRCGNALRPAANGGQEHVPPYVCPLAGEDPGATDCCEPVAPAWTCCRRPSLLAGFTLLQVCIGVGALVGVAVVTGTLAWCVWSERCPLHGLCTREAKPDYLAGPADVEGGEGATLMMPAENVGNVRVYEPNPRAKPPPNFV